MGPTGSVMERLGYRLPDFTRVSWTSEDARSVWQPRLAAIREAWKRIECLSVLEGIRPRAIVSLTPEELATWPRRFYPKDLLFIPLQVQGAPDHYSSTVAMPTTSRRISFRVAVSHRGRMADFLGAWDADAQDRIAELLGYPLCCFEFFRRFWIEQGYRDTTWPAAAATGVAVIGQFESSVEINTPPETNVLCRWLGARAVPHLPCTFDCRESVVLARALLNVGVQSGFDGEVQWLLQILRWPVEWSALNGIAEIKTPIAKVSAATETTSTKYVVRRVGDGYPAEGATGITFPYSTVKEQAADLFLTKGVL
jgi:hypothetical protein